jgi:hypothetical protein
MFIPKGKPMHQNLATSYVLVDALVADLCEGGFSGVVEIMLRDTDNHIVFNRGRIAGVIERRGDSCVTKTSVAELAARSRTERGRVSIFSYAIPVAKALAGRLFAETLYTKLSTEFADLEKLVGKFMRERERQWFIEAEAEGRRSLIFIEDGRCSVIKSEFIANESDLEIAGLANNLALLQLIEQCNNAGGLFDVYFKTFTDEAMVETPAKGTPASRFETAAPLPADDLAAEILQPHGEDRLDPEIGAVDAPPPLAQSSPWQVEIPTAFSDDNEPPIALPKATAATLVEADSEASTGFEMAAHFARSQNGAADPGALLSSAEAGDSQSLTPHKAKVQATPKASSLQQREIQILPTRELMALSSDIETAAQDLKMAEIKKLMGEIAKAIEDVLRIAEPRDEFPMHLRAGQLKLANQYAFLDPFGAEFEYMEGEIIFVGQASAEEFISGVTDALRLAFISALQSSANAPRLRSFVIDKLRFIFNRSREEYVNYGLDAALEQIAGVKL